MMTRLRTFTTAAATVLVLAACSSTSSTNAALDTSAATSSAAAPVAPSPSSAGVPAAAGAAITITAGKTVITANLTDTDAAQDFRAMLPVTLKFARSGTIEFGTDLAEPLTETGPFYTDVQPGDLAYYNPADSLTIIYGPTSSLPTITKIDEITSDLAVFHTLPDAVELSFALA